MKQARKCGKSTVLARSKPVEYFAVNGLIHFMTVNTFKWKLSTHVSGLRIFGRLLGFLDSSQEKKTCVIEGVNRLVLLTLAMRMHIVVRAMRGLFIDIHVACDVHGVNCTPTSSPFVLAILP